MKNLKLNILAAVMVIATTAFAQSTQDYNTILASFNFSPYTFDEKISLGDEGRSLDNTDGFAFSYLHAFNVTKKEPLFVETGIEWGMEFWSQSMYQYYFTLSTNLTTMRLSVPLNVVYKFQLGDFAIKPYTGLYLKFNVLSYMELLAHDINGKDITNMIPELDPDMTTVNLLDKKEMGDEVWNVFQAGWQIGAKFDYSCITLSLGYALDFVNLAPGINTSNIHAGIGFNF